MAAMTLFHATNSCQLVNARSVWSAQRLCSIDRQFLIYSTFGPVGSGNDPISLSLFFLLGRRSSKTPNSPSLQIVFGRNYARLFLNSFWFDVTLVRWRPWRPPAASWCICGGVRRAPAAR